MKPSSASASAAAMMKMSRFGATKAAESAKHDGRDDAEAAREPVHVVEQVERVREADEPEDPDRPGERLVRDELDRDRAVEDEERGDELGAELRGGMEVDDVVEQAEGEDDRRRAPTTVSISLGIPTGPIAVATTTAKREAGVDPDPAEGRRRARVPAVGARVGPERLERARPAQQPGDDEEGDRRRSDGDECVHGLRVARVWHRPQKRNPPGGRTRCPPTSPVQSRGGRLRRSVPLSRAVREPLPARPAREVQGIGARARLDARVAGDADARLPRRLLGDVKSPATDVDHYWLFLLCGLPPWVFFATSRAVLGAQPARERQPDPQGALPAAARAALDRGDAARRLRGDDGRSCSCSR